MDNFHKDYMDAWKQNDDNIFKNIQSYNPQELDGKTLKIIVVESEEGILISGKDIETDKIYVISYIDK